MLDFSQSSSTYLRMGAIELANRYDDFIEVIRSVIRPELYPQLKELKSCDPHDLVSPSA